MAEIYEPVVNPNPIAHILDEEYHMTGNVEVGDNEDIQWDGRNTENEFQFTIVPGTGSAGIRQFGETVLREGSETSTPLVTKKGGEVKGTVTVQWT